MGHSSVAGRRDPGDTPYAAVDHIRLLAALGKEANLVTPAHRAIGKLYRLGDMVLEVETEGAAARERVELTSEVGAEVGVHRLDMGQ